MFSKVNDLVLKAGVAATTFVLASAPSNANADIADIIDTVQNQIQDVPNAISYVAYICGAGMGMAGVFKLRQHVDSPAQVPMKDGLIRMVVAGGLVALPSLVGSFNDSVLTGGSAPDQMDF